MEESGAELRRIVHADLADMAGETINAYRAHSEQVARHLEGSARWAGAMGTGLEIASTMVQIVHDIVRDALAQIAGALCSYALEATLTLGLATPLIIEQAATRAAALATRISTRLTRLLASLKKLSTLLKQLDTLFRDFTAAAGQALQRPTPAIAGIPHAMMNAVPGPRPGPRPTPPPITPHPKPEPTRPKRWDEWDSYEIARQQPETRTGESGTHPLADTGPHSDNFGGTGYPMDEIAAMAHRHTGGGDINIGSVTKRPKLEQIEEVLAKATPRPYRGGTSLEYRIGDIRVVVNPKVPHRSTAMIIGEKVE